MIILSLRTPDYLGTTPPRIDLFLPDLDASEHTQVSVSVNTRQVGRRRRKQQCKGGNNTDLGVNERKEEKGSE